MSWTRRGGTSLEQTGSASSISVSYAALANSLLVVSVSWGTGTATDFTGVSDGTNSYTIPTGGRLADSGNGQGAGIAYCVVASSATLTVQANFGVSCTYRVITVEEYTCTGTWVPFDVLVTANPSGVAAGTDTISAGSLTTASDNELLHGYCVCTSNLSVNLTAGSAFTSGILQNTGGLTTLTQNRNVTPAGSATTAFSTTSGSNTWIAIGAAFKESGGGGGGSTATGTVLDQLARNRPGRGPHSLGRYYRPIGNLSQTLQPRSASASLGAALQVAQSATASLGAAIQLAASATASAGAAVQATGSASASLSLALQAAVAANASAQAAIQAAQAASASLSAYVQAGSTASSSLDIAVQAAAAATAGLSAYVQSGTSAVASLGAAVQVAQAASASLSAAVATAAATTTALGAAIALPGSASAALGTAIRASGVAALTFDVYIYDPDAQVFTSDSRSRVGPSRTNASQRIGPARQ